jgi:hypothetical protein
MSADLERHGGGVSLHMKRYSREKGGPTRASRSKKNDMLAVASKQQRDKQVHNNSC